MTRIKVYYGLDRKRFADVVDNCMISFRTMRKRKTGITNKDWFMDSGAFTYLKNEGKYPFSYGEYLRAVSKFKPTLFANMDWCCEETVLKSTGLNVLQHIGHTVENGRQLIDYNKDKFVMVLQGWNERDYLTCIDYCKDYGLITKVIGVGSICGRTNPKDVYEILKAIKYEIPDTCKIHCFGFSINLLKYKELYDRIDSIDTFAWCREYGLNKRGIVSERIETLIEYQKKVERIIDNNHFQSVLNYKVE
jgi:hypothetical protein